VAALPSMVWWIAGCGAAALALVLIIRPLIQHALIKKKQDPKVSALYLWLAIFILLFVIGKFMLLLF
jgi:hypothetical protein